MAVFVLDKRKKPLMPCSEQRARQMLARGRAVVHTSWLQRGDGYGYNQLARSA